jgi:hypothetical protein
MQQPVTELKELCFKRTDWMAGVLLPTETRFFSSRQLIDMLWGPSSLLSKWELGALSPGAKLPGREADHCPSSADVKNDEGISPLPHISFRHSS